MSARCLRVQALSGGFWSCADFAFCARVGWCLWPLCAFAFAGGNKDMEDEDENQVVAAGDDSGFM
jgi:hypothetical protein